jgi:hypothetical protein
MPRKIYKTYIRCSPFNSGTITGEFGGEVLLNSTDFTSNGIVSGSGYVAPPLGVGFVDSYPLSVSWSISIVALYATYGESTVQLSGTFDYADGSETEYIIEVVLTSNCTETLNTCEANKGDAARVLVWLNREGGYSAFTFSGKTTFEVEIPEGIRFNRSDYITRWASRNGVYNAEIVTTGNIPKESLDLLASLKYSTQVYLIENVGTLQQTQIPVLIEADDFVKRKTGDKLFDVSVKFIYAQELVMQSQ